MLACTSCGEPEIDTCPEIGRATCEGEHAIRICTDIGANGPDQWFDYDCRERTRTTRPYCVEPGAGFARCMASTEPDPLCPNDEPLRFGLNLGYCAGKNRVTCWGGYFYNASECADHERCEVVDDEPRCRS